MITHLNYPRITDVQFPKLHTPVPSYSRAWKGSGGQTAPPHGVCGTLDSEWGVGLGKPERAHAGTGGFTLVSKRDK